MVFLKSKINHFYILGIINDPDFNLENENVEEWVNNYK